MMMMMMMMLNEVNLLELDHIVELNWNETAC